MDRDAAGGTLVLGGGFAGAYVARLLGKHGATIVSPENFMLYTPLLPEAASGTLEPRHVVVPIRMMCPRAELLLGRAVALDTAGRRVEAVTENGRIAIGYRDVVVALGAVSRALPIPGLADHALPFKSLDDAIRLRNHVLRRLEAAAAAETAARRSQELTFVFVGAGYAGVEALAELSDLVRDALRYYPSLRNERRRWLLVDAAGTILPEIPRRLGEYAAAQLARRGVEILPRTTLVAAEADAATLSNGERVPTSTLVWTAGVRAHPRLHELGLPLDEDPVLGDAAERGVVAQRVADEVRQLGKRLHARIAGTHEHERQLTLALLSRKLRVVTDWTTALFFRRDIAELGPLWQRRRLEDA